MLHLDYTSLLDIGILKDWAFNMRNKDGNEYKESAVKIIWNSTAK